MIQNPLVLISVETLGVLISTLEKELPGYWYSISQKKDNLTLSLGPSHYCLLDADRAWALTKEGDSGIIHSLSRSIPEDEILNRFKEDILSKIFTKREELLITKAPPFPPYQPGRRVHDKEARAKVRKRYAQLIRELPTLQENGVDIEEIYIGSCNISVDCSIRGKFANKPFDESFDIKDHDATMADAVQQALLTVKQAFLSQTT
jgi:hypothetical protein